MKHVFYVIYVAGYSFAVFAAGAFVGQLLARHWARRHEEDAERRAPEARTRPIGMPAEKRSR